MKTVKVKNQICCVETLSEWLEYRLWSIKSAQESSIDYRELATLRGRFIELSIILEKINDGRIQEIGKVKFRRKK